AACVLDGSQIDLEPTLQLHAGPRFTLRDHFGDLAIGDDALHHLRAVAGRDEDVQVSDRLAPPPVASGDLHLRDPAARPQVRDDRIVRRLALVQQQAPLALLSDAEPRADLLLDLGPEALELLDPV